MAAPITHIVLANKVFNKYFKEKDKRKFFIGTSFPDIRYLGIIDREKTHFHNVSIEDVANEDSFTAGLKFHSLLDEKREAFIVSKNAYDFIPDSPFKTQALKFLEDQVLYDRVKDWLPYLEYFDNVIENEMAFGLKKENIEQWHTALKKTFKGIPNPDDLNEFVRLINRPPEMADEINKVLSEIRENQNLIDIINELYDSFEDIIL